MAEIYDNSDYKLKVQVFNKFSVLRLQDSGTILFCNTTPVSGSDINSYCNIERCAYKRYLSSNKIYSMTCRIIPYSTYETWICGRNNYMSSVIEMRSLISISYIRIHLLQMINERLSKTL